MAEASQPRHRALAVLDTGGCDDYRAQEPYRVDTAMPCVAVDVFVGLVAVGPPVAVVLTDGLSTIPALGGRGWPAATRTSPRRRSCMICQVPSWHHVRTAW